MADVAPVDPESTAPDLHVLVGGEAEEWSSYPHCCTMDWWGDAACRGEIVVGGRVLGAEEVANLFHPTRTDSPTVVTRAKSVCRQCPVQMECLMYAVDANETMGIWGGLGGKERRGIARRRRIANARIRLVES